MEGIILFLSDRNIRNVSIRTEDESKLPVNSPAKHSSKPVATDRKMAVSRVLYCI